MSEATDLLKLIYSRATKVGSAQKEEEFSTQDYFLYIGPENNEGENVRITFYNKEKLIIVSLFRRFRENSTLWNKNEIKLVLQLEGWLKTGETLTTVLNEKVDVIAEAKRLYQYLNLVEI